LDCGPVCYPNLVGPPNSNKLIILQHGFLACPGMWFRVVPRLIQAGFRVMLPTLPGHGRAFRFPANASDRLNVKVIDLDTGPIYNGSELDTDLSGAHDDIDDIPTTSAPYHVFSRTLGQLAAQFKNEHPDGIVAVGGHSLGGLVTANYAMDMPDVVDRVILLNPMLGVASAVVKAINLLAPNKIWGKGAKCEGKRGKGSGGTCQFKLANVHAMTTFARELLCDHLGISIDAMCYFHLAVKGPSSTSRIIESRTQLGRLKSFQVVTSRGEPAVDNQRIRTYVELILQIEAERLYTAGRRKDFKISGRDPRFCEWPSALGHSYLSNRESNKWWHPYVEASVANYLTMGKNIDVVSVGSSIAWSDCLMNPENVVDEYLSVLPAIQTRSYFLGRPSGPMIAMRADVLYTGDVWKESHTFGNMNKRHMEMLEYGTRLLIVTRMEANDNIRNIYDVRKWDVLNISVASERNGALCLSPQVDDVEIHRPLDQAIQKVQEKRSRGDSPRVLEFCGRDFVGALCKKVDCNSHVIS